MAEAWFNRLAVGRGKAESCGTMPAPESDPLVAQVLREVGINFPEQAPRALNQQLLRRAPLVVIVGKEVNSRAFDPIQVWDLPDPTGMTIEHYRLVRDAIRQLALELITELELPQERISIAR